MALVGRGRGRGAGPPHSGDPFGTPPPGYIPGRGRGATGFAGGVSRDDTYSSSGPGPVLLDLDRGDYSDANFDEFAGYGGALFAGGSYDADDQAADEMYAKVAARLDERRRTRREERFKQVVAQARAEKPTLSQQFSDLKAGLKSVSASEWEAVEEIGDYSLRKKRLKKAAEMGTTPLPVMAAKARSLDVNSTSLEAGSVTPLSARGGTDVLKSAAGRAAGGGTATVFSAAAASAAGISSSLNELGEARGAVLSVQLDRLMDSISGQTVVDPKNYLSSLPTAGGGDPASMKQARLLLKSVTQTNPQHVPGWVAAARLEEMAGKLEQARDLIAEGCMQCPRSEDIWLEAARLAPNREEAGATLASGLRQLPSSVALWQAAADLEQDAKLRRAIYRKALQHVPNSVRLWQNAVAGEPEETARIYLRRAVECIPTAVDLWLHLARLSPYAEAQKVLNEARKRVPVSPDIWIAAAVLEEQANHLLSSEKIVRRCVADLAGRGVHLDREDWLSRAEQCERRSPGVAAALVAATLEIGVEPVNRRRLWTADVEALLVRGSILCARTLLKQALNLLPSSEPLWLRLIDLERAHGGAASLEEALAAATAACPGSEKLWLLAASARFAAGGAAGAAAARRTLAEAAAALPAPEQRDAVALEAAKLELALGNVGEAAAVLREARKRGAGAAVWLRAVELERDDLAARNAAGGEAGLAARGAAAGSAGDEGGGAPGVKAKAAGSAAGVAAGDAAGSTPSVAAESTAGGAAGGSSDIAAGSTAGVGAGLTAAPAASESTAGGAPAAGGAGGAAAVCAAAAVCGAALSAHPNSAPLWEMAGRLREDAGDVEGALAVYARGRERCPEAVPLWTAAVGLLRRTREFGRGRALAEVSRKVLPKQPALWLAAVQLEAAAGGGAGPARPAAAGGGGGGSGTSHGASRATGPAASGSAAAGGPGRGFDARATHGGGTVGFGGADAAGAAAAGGAGSAVGGGLGAARALVTRALSECPKDGALWAEAIFLEEPAGRNAKSVQALSACENDAHVLLAVARVFWDAKKFLKAERWLERAIQVDPALGDSWGVLFYFTRERPPATAAAEPAAAEPAAAEPDTAKPAAASAAAEPTAKPTAEPAAAKPATERLSPTPPPAPPSAPAALVKVCDRATRANSSHGVAWAAAARRRGWGRKTMFEKLQVVASLIFG